MLWCCACAADELGAIKCPVLLIWGEEERVFGEQHLRWFSDHLPTKNREVDMLDCDIYIDPFYSFIENILPCLSYGD
jgi:pimeloyl-ACP methyl ester carboxylesterase